MGNECDLDDGLDPKYSPEEMTEAAPLVESIDSAFVQESPHTPVVPIVPTANRYQLDLREVKEETCSAEYILERIKQLSEEALPCTIGKIKSLVESNNLPGMAFDYKRNNSDDKVIILQEKDIENKDIWFIGDLHGDILALETALAYVTKIETQTGKNAIIVFLGDFFDRGCFSCETVTSLFQHIAEAPGKYCILAGNHDVSLDHDGTEFKYSVRPHEFCDDLNKKALTHSLYKELGILCIDFFSKMPRAIFFPNGLLATHGGFPLSDGWDTLSSKEMLNDQGCLQDFTWTRISTSQVKKKKPNRLSKTCQFGYQDFEAFCAMASNLLGQSVSMMIRGHDHEEKGYRLYEKYPALTINTMSLCEDFGCDSIKPCMALYQNDAIPQVHMFNIPSETIMNIYSSKSKENAE